MEVQVEKTHTLNLYSPCIQKCRMCHAEKFKSIANPIDLNNVKKELFFAKDSGYKLIDFVGTEPTLFSKLLEAIIYSKNLGLKPAIFTNAQRLADASYVKKLIPLKPIGIKTSFHSHKRSVFEYITGVRGSYSRILKAFNNIHKYLSSAPSRTDGLLVNVVINSYNYKDLPEIVNFLFNHHVRLIKLTQLLMMGNIYNNPDMLIDLGKVRPFFVRAVSLMKKLKMNYDFDSLPICFMESESKHFNTMYEGARGIKLILC